METKEFIIEELKANDEARTIEGYGSVFGNVDSTGDIVMPGAFVRSLKAREPAMLWQHDTRMPVGVWDQIEERERGLFMKGRILDTTAGEDAYKLVKAKAVKGLSIGFSTKRYEIDEKKNVRKLLDLDLYEVSLVTFPANEKANITRVKSAPDNERDFEELLREAGYPRDAAKIITARGFKALSGQREAGAEGLSTLSTLLQQFKF